MLPLVAVPTTAGTGSEVAWAAVINRAATGERLSLGSPLIAARVAVVDPTFAAGLPPHLAAGTGMDALAHAVEGLTSRRATPFGDAFAAEAIRRVGRSLARLVAERGNLDAAGDMALAATMAGFVLNYSSIHLGHAMGRPLSTWYGLHHGTSVGILLAPIMEYARVGNAGRFGRVARLLGVGDGLAGDELALAGVEAVRDLQRTIGIPATLAEAGVPPADADRLGDSVAAYPGPLEACPRPVGRAELRALFRALLPT
jgi:alcohol dehydrogenase class IV